MGLGDRSEKTRKGRAWKDCTLMGKVEQTRSESQTAGGGEDTAARPACRAQCLPGNGAHHWPSTAIIGGLALDRGPGAPPSRRQGVCTGWNGARALWGTLEMRRPARYHWSGGSCRIQIVPLEGGCRHRFTHWTQGTEKKGSNSGPVVISFLSRHPAP